MKKEEQEWFEKWQQGDDAYFDSLFNKFYKSLCFVAAARIDDRNHAEDIVQDLFTDLYKRREKIELSTSIDKYVYGALFYKCRDFNQKKNRTISIEESSFEEKDSDGSPSDHVEQLELEAEIFNAIDSLPPKSREVFMLSRFDQMKNAEIAAHLNISIKTVESHISYALRKLRSVFFSHLNVLIIAALWYLNDFFS